MKIDLKNHKIYYQIIGALSLPVKAIFLKINLKLNHLLVKLIKEFHLQINHLIMTTITLQHNQTTNKT